MSAVFGLAAFQSLPEVVLDREAARNTVPAVRAKTNSPAFSVNEFQMLTNVTPITEKAAERQLVKAVEHMLHIGVHPGAVREFFNRTLREATIGYPRQSNEDSEGEEF